MFSTATTDNVGTTTTAGEATTTVNQQTSTEDSDTTTVTDVVTKVTAAQTSMNIITVQASTRCQLKPLISLVFGARISYRR